MQVLFQLEDSECPHKSGFHQMHTFHFRAQWGQNGIPRNAVLNDSNQITADYSRSVSAVRSVPLATRGVHHVVKEFALTSYVAHSHGIIKSVFSSDLLT